MDGITSDAENFLGNLKVFKGGQRDTNKSFSCTHYGLQRLAVGHSVGAAYILATNVVMVINLVNHWHYSNAQSFYRILA